MRILDAKNDICQPDLDMSMIIGNVNLRDSTLAEL
jgi:hypothetical protein